MADLAEIAAAAGITIIDSEPNEGGDMKDRDGEKVVVFSSDYLPTAYGDQHRTKDLVSEWEALFSYRYTEADPEYVKTLEEANVLNEPPCEDGFNCRRHRNDSRNWNRDRDNYSHGRYDGGDHGGYRSRGGYNRDSRDWNRRDNRDGGGGGGWGRDRSRDHPRNYGDYNRYNDQQSQGYGNQPYHGQREQQGQRYSGYQYRNYDERGRGHRDQRWRESDRGSGQIRDRSPPR